MNEFLLPNTWKWYLDHGIPYRRGYLFSGPPGSGKTSLTPGLVGCFGLDIYSVSLADPDTDESDLVQLFSTISKRCIVLFENIDAAGLTKRASEDITALQHKAKSHGGMAHHHGRSLSDSSTLSMVLPPTKVAYSP